MPGPLCRSVLEFWQGVICSEQCCSTLLVSVDVHLGCLMFRMPLTWSHFLAGNETTMMAVNDRDCTFAAFRYCHCINRGKSS